MTTIDLTSHAAATGQAIVTGADGGIARAAALELADAGFDVGLTWSTDQSAALAVAQEIRSHGRWAEVRWLDVRTLADDPSGVEVIDDLAGALGGLSVFVNTTGPAVPAPFVDLSFEEWRDALVAGIAAPALLAQRAARVMIARRTPGRIINVTSVHEHVVVPGASADCTAKSALGTLTKVMALELAEHGITVNTVAPGDVAEPLTGQHGVDPSSADRPGIPAGRAAGVHEIAHAIVYLAGPGADYVTGTSIVVDGGKVLTMGSARQLVG